MAKAFIFSLDAFVAFTLILVVLHALVFLAAVPSSYYGGLMQADYLARDTLNSLANANAAQVVSGYGYDYNITLLDYVFMNPSAATIQDYVGPLIPNEYGYRLEFWNSTSATYGVIYDTKDRDDSEDPHNKYYHKLQVSAHALYFGYLKPREPTENPYCYVTCHGEGCSNLCGNITSRYEKGTAKLGLVRLTVYR